MFKRLTVEKISRVYEVLLVLTQKDIKVKYKNNKLGYLWALANPLFFTLIYYLAFKVFMRVQVENYPAFLVCALFPWQWITNSITNGAWCFLGNAQIIKKTTFPKFTLILSNVFMEGFHFLMSVPVILLFLWYSGITLHLDIILFLPLLCIIQIILSFSLSLLFSTLCVFFRDIERFVTLAMTALFYATPIFYSEKMIPENYQWIIKINPFAELITLWRNLFMSGAFDWFAYFKILGIGIVFLVLASLIYNKLKFKFAEVL